MERRGAQTPQGLDMLGPGQIAPFRLQDVNRFLFLQDFLVEAVQRALQLLSNLITQDQTLLGLIQEHPALDGIDLHQHVVAHSMALRTRRGSSLMTVAE